MHLVGKPVDLAGYQGVRSTATGLTAADLGAATEPIQRLAKGGM